MESVYIYYVYKTYIEIYTIVTGVNCILTCRYNIDIYIKNEYGIMQENSLKKYYNKIVCKHLSEVGNENTQNIHRNSSKQSRIYVSLH